MKSRGFTLIEVLVAMVVLGTACVALFGLISSSLFNLRKLEDRHRYELVGEDVMTRVQLVSLPPEGGIRGKVKDPDAEWKVTVTPWVPSKLDSKPSEAIMKIDVDVLWAGRSGQRSFRLETVRPASIRYENYDFQEAFDKVFPH